MRDDKNSAEKMRSNGSSYKEISRKLRIPISTLSTWFSDESWSKQVKNRLTLQANKENRVKMRGLNKIRGIALEEAYKTASLEAEAEFEELKYHPLFVSGIMLYWGEGDKVTKYAVRLVNTDYKLVKVYVTFLKEVCKIPATKIKSSLLLYPDLENDVCLAFWSSNIDVARENFTKSTVIEGRHKSRRVTYGICTVTVSSTYFKVKMLRWMELMPAELLRKGYYYPEIKS
ncbi:MAG: hypothetical protein ISR99_00305 [Parcubacteria group bacterium]|nr:hypothetical protein [Parcubacteria group bacterium]